MANAWEPQDDLGQLQLIDVTDTVQNHPLGLRVKARHATYGVCEFIYLKGVASTVAGDPVIWDSAFQTTRAATSSRGPIGFSMTANVANQYGWYCIAGLALGSSGANSVAANAALQIQATATLDDTTTAGQYIDGCTSKAASSGGFTLCALSYPHMNGR
jgi:hypothetical protein